MSDLTPAQRIEAAIVRLEELKRDYFIDHGWLCELVTTGIEPNPVQEPAPLTNDPMMVTLHVTIDPMLTLLKIELDYAHAKGGIVDELFLPLADAIISGGTE